MNPDGNASPFAPSVIMAVPRIAGVPDLEFARHTDPGRDPNKQVNEDASLARDTPHGFLAVVCDGMGGHVGGREASHLAIETIFRVFDATPFGASPQQLLRDALTQANGAVYARGVQAPELKGMGSTCVAVLVHAGGTDIAHVGDSRVYLLSQGQVYQVTKDHSLVQRLVDANMLTPEQAANHPNANQITNAFGQRPDIEVEVRPHAFPYGGGDVFVLCSDGLSDEVGPQDILAVLAPQPPADLAARQLVDLANARGGHDNITVVLVRFPGGLPFAALTPAAPGVVTPTAAIPVVGAAATSTAEMAIVQAPSQTLGPPPPFTPPPAFTPPPSYPTPPPAYGTPVEVPRKGSRKGLVVAVVLALLLVAAGVAAALHFGGSSGTGGEGSKSADEKEPASEDDAGKKITKQTGKAPTGVSAQPSADPEPAPTPSTKKSAGPTPKPTNAGLPTEFTKGASSSPPAPSPE